MPDIVDPYVYPETRILRNLLEIRDPAALEAFEADATIHRLAELHANPASGRFDTAHLKAIHRRIFQDVYDWAGQFRTVDLSKGGHLFARPPYIESALQDLFRQLAGENFLRESTVENFAQRAGFYLTEMNAVHPFREGNGRTQREFLRELAIQAGFALDWRRVTREEMTAASRESFATGDSASLVAIVRSCQNGPR
jgi:cell filamentation protein